MVNPTIGCQDSKYWGLPVYHLLKCNDAYDDVDSTQSSSLILYAVNSVCCMWSVSTYRVIIAFVVALVDVNFS